MPTAKISLLTHDVPYGSPTIGIPSYWNVTFVDNDDYGVGPLNPNPFDAWCVNPTRYLSAAVGVGGVVSLHATYTYGMSANELVLNTALPASLFSGSGPDPIDRLDSVNWLLNQHFTTNPQYSVSEAQLALWRLLGFGPSVSEQNLYSSDWQESDVQALVNAALADSPNGGNGFVPKADDVFAVIADPVFDYPGYGRAQPIIIETRFAKLGDFVWHDLNANGIQDTGEPAIAGATVTLNGTDAFGGVVSGLTTTTDANGKYLFERLVPGTYTVSFTTPAGFDGVSPRQAPAGTAANNSDGLMSDAVALKSGDDNRTIDSGFYQFASLGNYVWEDLNANGIQDDGAASGIGGVTVTLVGGGADELINGIGDSTSTTSTNGSGFYQFTGLTPGVQYQVTFAKPAAYISFTKADAAGDALDSDADVITGKAPIVVLASGEYNDTVDAGLLKPAAIGDYVWRDSNGNGLQDEIGTGVPNVTAKLSGTDALGNPVLLTTTTNASGGYLFNGNTLLPGTYNVTFSNLPPGLAFTAPDQGSDDATDSDANPITGATPSVTVGSGQSDLTLDAGLVGTGIDIIKYVNGQDANSAPGPALVVGSAADFTYDVRNTGDVSLAGVTVSDDNGTPGNAGDDFAPAPLLAGGFNAGDTNTNNLLDAGETWKYQATKTVVAGQYTNIATTTGTPVYPPGTHVSGTPVPNLAPPTANDPANYNGTLPQQPGIEVIKDVVGATIVAPNTPVTYAYSVLNRGGVPLSNIVFTDDNATPEFAADDFSPTPVLAANGKNIGDLNGDNLLDLAEVWKYSATVTPPVNMTVAVATGATPVTSGALSYLTLANGDIRVFYLQDNNFNDNTYGTGSDAGWAAIGKTHKFGDLVGSDKAGFLLKYSDGTTLAQFYQDYITASTTNIDGYTTYSGYQSLGFSGGDGSWVAGSTTAKTWFSDFDSTLETNLNQPGLASNGVAYNAMFTNSPVSDAKWEVVNGYYFTISAAAFAGGKSFGGVTIFDQHNSPAKVGGSNTYIPDIVGGASVNTAVVTGVGNGTTVSGDDDATVSIITGPLGSLGDRVWYDTNANGVQNAAEAGIVGVKLLLEGDFDQNGTIDYSATTTTGANGIYTFTGLPAGEYKVTVDASTLPANYIQTYDLDGLATPNAALGELAAGQDRTDFDFGYVATAPGFALVKTADKTNAAFGEPVTYTYAVKNTGAQALGNVLLKDDNGTPDDPLDDFVLASPTGDSVNPGLLDAGETWTYTKTVTPPIQLVANNVNGYTGPAGMLSYATLANGDIRVTYRQSTNVNDNNYASSGNAPAWNRTHTFNDLVGSDKAGFELKDTKGATVMKFYMDYITASSTQEAGGVDNYTSYSGHRSLGATGGDGSMVVGSATNLYDFDSTLELNLNRPGYTTTTASSPLNDANWDYVNGYSFTVKAGAFGAAGFGGASIFDQHNSPSKLGVNSFVPTPSGGAVTNTAVVTATLNGSTSTVVAIDEATVIVGPTAGGPAKFFVVDIGADDVFKYSDLGSAAGEFALLSANKDPRDIAANNDGSKLWVLDKAKNVYVYDASGTSLGAWKADGIGKEPEGLTLDPSVDPQTGAHDLWMASRDRKIVWYDDAASNTSGTDKNDKSFAPAMSGNLKGIVTDGTFLWAVTEGGTDYVYRFTIARDAATGDPTGLTQSGLWKLATANSKPTGITIDPTGTSQSIWVVDESSDTVYEYGNGRSLTTGTGAVSSSFKLAATNLAPQGIADPLSWVITAGLPDVQDDTSYDAADLAGVDQAIDTLFLLGGAWHQELGHAYVL